MLHVFGHCVAMCCDMLGVVGSNLKMVKIGPTTPNMSQHIATRWPNARNMLHPTMLRSFGWGLSPTVFVVCLWNEDLACLLHVFRGNYRAFEGESVVNVPSGSFSEHGTGRCLQYCALLGA